MTAEERAREDSISAEAWDIWYLRVFNALPDKARTAISLHQWRSIGREHFVNALTEAEQRGAEREREACIKIAENMPNDPEGYGLDVADAIRARGKP